MTRHSESVSEPRPNRIVIARTRGAVTGSLLILLGAWGALIPFVGHYFSFGYTPDTNWTWTAARFWLEVLPGAATFVGGVLLTSAADRITATLGGWLAAAAGAWFVLGTTFAPLWNAGFIGLSDGSVHRGVIEHLALFDGLGVIILILAAIGVGRISVLGVRDVRQQQRRADAEAIDLRDAAPTEPVTS